MVGCVGGLDEGLRPRAVAMRQRRVGKWCVERWDGWSRRSLVDATKETDAQAEVRVGVR